MQRRLLLDVVVTERATVLELLAREDQALLVWGDALLVLDLGLDIVCYLSYQYSIFQILQCDRMQELNGPDAAKGGGCWHARRWRTDGV